MAVFAREFTTDVRGLIQTDEDAWYGTHTVYILDDNGNKVAYGSIDLEGGYRIANDPGIWAVRTDPEHRRKGYATLIMKELITIARAAGAERVRLQATPEGRYVYEKLGFVPFSDENSYGDSWMVLHLSPEGESAATAHGSNYYTMAVDKAPSICYSTLVGGRRNPHQ